MKAVRSLSEPPTDMQILSSKSLACALAAALLVADGDERVPFQPDVAEPRLVIPHGTPNSAVSWVEGGGATVKRVRALDGPDIDKD